jgi:hypothetical protein
MGGLCTESFFDGLVGRNKAKRSAVPERSSQSGGRGGQGKMKKMNKRHGYIKGLSCNVRKRRICFARQAKNLLLDADEIFRIFFMDFSQVSFFTLFMVRLSAA